MPEITEPGVYEMTAHEYHADPVPGGSLSSSGARLLLPPNCPARFRYEQNNGREEKTVFDFGHAAHRFVLGRGSELAVVEADNWKTKAAREERFVAYEEGRSPLLQADYEQAIAMAQAIKEHPIAGALFSHGKPEQALFWVDEPSGIWRRALLDWLPDRPANGRMIVPDYKTSKSADPGKIQRAIHDYGYHQQAAWYLDGIHELGIAEEAVFVFVFQEKTPPYLVTVAEPDIISLRIGRHLNRKAIDIYRDCVANDRWPGYSDDVELIPLPAWVENQHLQEDIHL